MAPPPPAVTPALSTARLEGSTLIFHGDWTKDARLEEIPSGTSAPTADLSGVGRWDSTLVATLLALRQKNPDLTLTGAPENLAKLLTLASKTAKVEPSQTHPPMDVVAHSGHRYRTALWLQHAQEATVDAIAFLGEIFIRGARVFATKEHFRPRDWFVELQEAGYKALPIVAFLSFLVGLILAFVSSMQLKLFGASIYVADLVGLSMTREMGALITAIIMAGRTGAAYAAQIGSMKRSEELDALKTMGLSPIDMVVLPKVAALTVMVPLLTVFSIFVGMFAGLIMATTVLDMSVFQYINETAHSVASRHFVIGVLKAVVYGFLVAYAGAWRGTRCGSSADAVGKAATSAVVMSLTLIVVANALFAVLLNALQL